MTDDSLSLKKFIRLVAQLLISDFCAELNKTADTDRETLITE